MAGCSSPFYSALSAGTVFPGMREKILWPEKVLGEVVEEGGKLVAETSSWSTTIYGRNQGTDSFDQTIPGLSLR